MKISLTLHTKLGVFESEQFDMTRAEFDDYRVKMKNFYEFAMDFPLPQGFAVVSPEIIKESVLEIKIKKKHVAE